MDGNVYPFVCDILQVDHYNRVAKGSSRRVVGILLGEADADGKVVGRNTRDVCIDRRCN